MIKNCVKCGRKFSTRHPLQKYCTETCRKQANAVNKPKKSEQRVCLTCGHIFQATPTNNKKFCCTSCKLHFNPDRKKKKLLEEWATEAQACGMTYGKYRTQIEHFGKTFEELQKLKEDMEN